MEHRLITGGHEFLPFARSCVAKLKKLGLPYANQSYEVGGVSIKVRIEPGHEYIRIDGGVGEFLTLPHNAALVDGDRILPSGALGRGECYLTLGKKLASTEHSPYLAGRHDWQGKLSYYNGWYARYALAVGSPPISAGRIQYREITNMRTGTTSTGTYTPPDFQYAREYYPDLLGRGGSGIYMKGRYLATRHDNPALGAYEVAGAAIVKGADDQKYIVFVSPYIEWTDATGLNLTDGYYLCRKIHVYACLLSVANTYLSIVDRGNSPPPPWSRIGEFVLDTSYAAVQEYGEYVNYLFPNIGFPWFFNASGTIAATVMTRYQTLRGSTKLYTDISISSWDSDKNLVNGIASFRVESTRNGSIFAVDFKGDKELEIYTLATYDGNPELTSVNMKIMAEGVALYERRNEEVTYKNANGYFTSDYYDQERLTVIDMDARSGFIAYEAFCSYKNGETITLKSYICAQRKGVLIGRKQFGSINHPRTETFTSITLPNKAVAPPTGAALGTMILWNIENIYQYDHDAGNAKFGKAGAYIVSVATDKYISMAYDVFSRVNGVWGDIDCPDMQFEFKAINVVSPKTNKYETQELVDNIPLCPLDIDGDNTSEFAMFPIKV